TVLKNKPFILFLALFMLITITHRANDSFIGLFITELGGSEDLVGVAWFIALVSEATVFATAGFWLRKFHPVVFVIAAGLLYSIANFTWSNICNSLSVRI